MGKRLSIRTESEEAATLALMPVVLLALLAIIGLVVDAVMAMASQEQQLHMCEYASLGALHEYLQADTDYNDPLEVRYQARLNQALARANEIGVRNSMISSRDDASSEFELLSLDLTSLGTPPNPNEQNGGLLIPGAWKTDPECPEGSDYCFIANENGDYSASAFKCQAQLASPIRTLVARIFGAENMWITAEAVAAVGPKQMIMAMDLSPSMTRRTYLQLRPRIGDPLYYEQPIEARFCGNPGVQYIARLGIRSEYAYNVGQGYWDSMDVQPNDIHNYYSGFRELAIMFKGHYPPNGDYPYPLSSSPPTGAIYQNGQYPYFCSGNWQDKFTICRSEEANGEDDTSASCNSGAGQGRDPFQPWEEDLILKPKKRQRPTNSVTRYRSDYELIIYREDGGTDASGYTTCPGFIDDNPDIPVRVINAPGALNMVQPADDSACYLVDTYRYTEDNYSAENCEEFFPGHNLNNDGSLVTPIDWYCNSSSLPDFNPDLRYDGPQPFTEVLTAVKTTAEYFDLRANSDDQLGLFPFDESVFEIQEEPFRTFPLGPPADLRTEIDLLSLDDQLEHGLMPRAGHNTDLINALEVITNHYEENTLPGALRSIVLVTDGIANCTPDGACENELPEKREAYVKIVGEDGEELNNTTLARLIEQDIQVNPIVVYAGKEQPHSKPHTYNIQRQQYVECCEEYGPPGSANLVALCADQCREKERWMDDKDAMEAEEIFVESESHGGSDAPYKGPHVLLWKLAKLTGGRFFALRDVPPDAHCTDDEYGNPVCECKIVSESGELTDESTPTGETSCAYATEGNSCVPRAPAAANGGNKQKQEYDPYCRNHLQQLKEFMLKIIQESNQLVLRK